MTGMNFQTRSSAVRRRYQVLYIDVFTPGGTSQYNLLHCMPVCS
ncbi:hypothetical protein [uncultured Robinsoniella sp.]